MGKLSRKQRKMLWRILAAAALFFPLFIVKEAGLWDFSGNRFLELACFLVPYLIIGYDVLWKALRNLLHGRVFDECFLMLVATVGAIVIGFLPGAETENAEAVGVMLFYQIGEFFQSVAVGKSRRSISSLMSIRPDEATVLREDGSEETVDPAEVPVGSTIVVRPGERIPLDGEVTDGVSSLDTAALTGESLPRDVRSGDAVVSGCVNVSGLLKIRTTKVYGESTVARILDLVETSTEAKAKSERFITRFARVYTPAVVLAAVLLATIPPLFDGNLVRWITRALTFLVVSCPCALVISVPLSFFGGIGGASRRGILVKGATYLEALEKADTVVFDKTGTLTEGRFSVVGIYPESNCDAETLLSLAAHAECYSEHPIARSLCEAYGKDPDHALVSSVEELTGHGVAATVGNKRVCVGNGRLMEDLGISLSATDAIGTVVHVARNRIYLGYIEIADRPKADARDAIDALKRAGIKRTVMLTGDRASTAESVATALTVDEYRAELLPADKVTAMESILEERRTGGTLVFVGDGINDAPVLARADIGIAMGAFGTDAAIEAADIVLMDDKPSRVAEAIRIARKTMRIVRQNIVFAIGIKIAVMVLAAFGLASMWLAVFADVGVAVIAILNAMRTLK